MRVENRVDEDKNIIRSKTLSDGSIERQTINPNTGKVLKVEEVQPVDPPIDNKYDVKENKPITVIKLPETKGQKTRVYTLDADGTEVNIEQYAPNLKYFEQNAQPDAQH